MALCRDERSSRQVQTWLWVCALAVLMMAVIGAVTRLTESGLSIVEWKPIAGALPPMNETAWQSEFDLYQTSPQYQQVNHGMTLAEFKQIYFWEWFHRLWGRMIGFLVLIPALWFMVRKKLTGKAMIAVVGLLVLGGLQGLMGWVMVKSGLVHMPAVSHFRLAAHLMLAALIYVCFIRFALACRGPRNRYMPRFFLWLCVLSVTVTMTWGAFVAGLRAGLLYPEFPWMGEGRIIPNELLDARDPVLAILTEPASVQFTHRLLAMVTVFILLLTAMRLRRAKWQSLIIFAVLGQAGLGIATLMLHVPVHLAAAHQAGGFIVLGLLMWLLYHPEKQRPEEHKEIG